MLGKFDKIIVVTDDDDDDDDLGCRVCGRTFEGSEVEFVTYTLCFPCGAAEWRAYCDRPESDAMLSFDAWKVGIV